MIKVVHYLYTNNVYMVCALFNYVTSVAGPFSKICITLVLLWCITHIKQIDTKITIVQTEKKMSDTT